MSKDFEPSTEQRRQAAAAATEFESRWEYHPPTRTYSRRDEKLLRRAWHLIIGKRQSIFGMYWYTKKLFHEHNGADYMAFRFPIDQDNMPMKGYDRKYVLKEGVTVRRKDLKFLRGGPLYSTQEDRIIVDAYPVRSSIWKLLKDYLYPVAGFVASIVTIATIVIQLLDRL